MARRDGPPLLQSCPRSCQKLQPPCTTCSLQPSPAPDRQGLLPEPPPPPGPLPGEGPSCQPDPQPRQDSWPLGPVPAAILWHRGAGMPSSVASCHAQPGPREQGGRTRSPGEPDLSHRAGGRTDRRTGPSPTPRHLGERAWVWPRGREARERQF